MQGVILGAMSLRPRCDWALQRFGPNIFDLDAFDFVIS
jgi:hypothetical protein